jgi:protein involved in polysaccharide export with SLBB domain
VEQEAATLIPGTMIFRMKWFEPAKRRRGWLRTALRLCMLVLPVLGCAQTTLLAPTVEDPQCAEQNCAFDLKPSASVSNRTPMQAANRAGTTGGPPTDALSSSEEQATNADPARPPKGGTASTTDALPEPPTEFQEFVTSSVGHRLPIYGHNLFDRVPTTFAPVDRIPVTADYVIGPGDEILIRAWGQIDLNGKLVVDRAGEVFLPKVGTLSVAGLKYQQLAEYFKTAIGRVFRNFDLTVSLGQLRSIQVFVVGRARRPGSYTVSSLCTLVNALFASGGPSTSGSMRHIQLKRDGRVITEFDLYDLLLQGDKSKDVQLLPGDVIYIPPTGPSIAIAGSVNMPAIYELRDGTSLGGAVEMA